MGNSHLPPSRLIAIRSPSAAQSTKFAPSTRGLEPAVERYGLYVDRRAFGPDLYDAGRSSMLTQTRDRRPRSAQDQLEHAWAIARATLTDDADASDLEATDAMVRGDIPLSCEAGG